MDAPARRKGRAARRAHRSRPTHPDRRRERPRRPGCQHERQQMAPVRCAGHRPSPRQVHLPAQGPGHHARPHRRPGPPAAHRQQRSGDGQAHQPRPGRQAGGAARPHRPRVPVSPGRCGGLSRSAGSPRARPRAWGPDRRAAHPPPRCHLSSRDRPRQADRRRRAVPPSPARGGTARGRAGPSRRRPHGPGPARSQDAQTPQHQAHQPAHHQPVLGRDQPARAGQRRDRQHQDRLLVRPVVLGTATRPGPDRRGGAGHRQVGPTQTPRAHPRAAGGPGRAPCPGRPGPGPPRWSPRQHPHAHHQRPPAPRRPPPTTGRSAPGHHHHEPPPRHRAQTTTRPGPPPRPRSAPPEKPTYPPSHPWSQP